MSGTYFPDDKKEHVYPAHSVYYIKVGCGGDIYYADWFILR